MNLQIAVAIGSGARERARKTLIAVHENCFLKIQAKYREPRLWLDAATALRAPAGAMPASCRCRIVTQFVSFNSTSKLICAGGSNAVAESWGT